MGGQGNRLLLTGKTFGSVEGSRTAARAALGGCWD
jgi:hypothetical protein